MEVGSMLNETKMGRNNDALSLRKKKVKLSGIVSPQERNKMRGVSF